MPSLCQRIKSFYHEHKEAILTLAVTAVILFISFLIYWRFYSACPTNLQKLGRFIHNHNQAICLAAFGIALALIIGHWLVGFGRDRNLDRRFGKSRGTRRGRRNRSRSRSQRRRVWDHDGDHADAEEMSEEERVKRRMEYGNEAMRNDLDKMKRRQRHWR